MTNENKKPCDLIIVTVDRDTYVAEVPRDIAKIGDRVDFLVKDLGLICGFVEDILQCDFLDNTYCFIAAAVTIYKPCCVYSRIWACDQIREGLIG